MIAVEPQPAFGQTLRPAAPPVAMPSRRDAAPGPHAAERSAPRFPAALADFAVGAALPLLWALGHAYGGIEGDARIYMGRVLADLDPGGVGRDIMFVLDGQSRFSLYRCLARTLAAWLGFGPAVALLSVVPLAAWFGAAVVFARTLATGRALALVLAALCLLPRPYAPWNLLGAGEAIAVPRPLAEAGVLLALAAFCRGRLLLGTGALAVAAAFHPIMAAPGLGVLAVVLGLRDRRWLVGAALGVGALGAGALAGVPFLSRLATPVDPVWRHILEVRTPYLFLRAWPADVLGPASVQFATILIAATWLPARPRTVFLGALIVALLGCAAAALFGDGLSDQLVLEAQPWRALWLPAALAPVAAGLCLCELPGRGPAGQVALAALCLGWLTADAPSVAAVAALVAAAVWFGRSRTFFALGRPGVVAAWVACALVAAASLVPTVAALAALLARMPAELGGRWHLAWQLRLFTLPAIGLLFALWRWPRTGAARIAACCLCLGSAALFGTGWDLRTPAHADADAAILKPDLVAALRTRPGAVLWLDGDDGWYWARRANWDGPMQGGGIVFSRELALRWHARTEAMIEAGLATPWLLAPLRHPAPLRALPLDEAKIGRFCRRADAPAWIVSALEPDALPPAGLAAAIWRPRLPQWTFTVAGGDVRWRKLDRYALVPCAPAAGRS